MQTTVEADGDELVVVIPPEILDRAELEIGDEVELSIENGVIVTKCCG
ncbi:AbrB/MazE/SpoVT family DNA-binding domain-containing protein [Marinobacter flavimaris]|uniref:AbrB/MazE/SpoVT family DNA-binding domain-containing protein n=1 Tax=Marinobacter flavimaris TaxID=262076 RepID=A0A3D8H908_9GAMM|nr:AbrB/MazE/SpoVT family DNA-binding domain-containing protein [Marinobacter flavimaris]RDU42949.1 AbrB/MazE/SpoVT family DNA-binding domain-containing protein [Marinobacter flavimaris]